MWCLLAVRGDLLLMDGCFELEEVFSIGQSHLHFLNKSSAGFELGSLRLKTGVATTMHKAVLYLNLNKSNVP